MINPFGSFLCEARGVLFAAEAFDEMGVGLVEVDQEKAIQDVAEVWVDVEAQEAGGEFHVLAEEHGNALAVGFDFLDEVGDFVDVTHDGGVAFHGGCTQGT